MVVPETMKQLKGWKYPLYVDRSFFNAPELIETLIDHGVPRELITLKDIIYCDNCDFRAVVRYHPKDYDQIAIELLLNVTKDELGRLSGCSPIQVSNIRITSSEWFKRTDKNI
jgi:hypothetical protein